MTRKIFRCYAPITEFTDATRIISDFAFKFDSFFYFVIDKRTRSRFATSVSCRSSDSVELRFHTNIHIHWSLYRDTIKLSHYIFFHFSHRQPFFLHQKFYIASFIGSIPNCFINHLEIRICDYPTYNEDLDRIK